jgi:2,5-diketo-D-gluconate reductase A
MTQIPAITLSDGRRMPQFGFGVWQIADADTPRSVKAAIEAGYRLIDTAAIYRNEEGVGRGMRMSGVAREELFITTKVWNSEHGYDKTLRAFDASLKKLELDYVDLYLIHWPAPQQGLYVETWKACIALNKQGRAKSIGVSNFNAQRLQDIMDKTGVVPAVNQIELHPRFQQAELRGFHARHGIATESWSPLGRGALSGDAAIAAIARKHRKTPAQVILRWHINSGLIVIPKSVTPARIRENISIFDFKLDADDMKAMTRLDSSSGRSGPDPESASF